MHEGTENASGKTSVDLNGRVNKKGLFPQEFTLRINVLIESIRSHLASPSVFGHFMQTQVCPILKDV